MDWAKIIGIFLVVFGHLLQITMWRHPELMDIWNIIYLFHMPLFFVLSGYMFKESYSFKKIFLTLVIPYMVYQVLFMPIALLLRVYNGERLSAVLFVKQVLGGLLGDGYDTLISYPDCLPCWFIICIIQIRTLFHIVPINRFTSTTLIILSTTLLLLLHYNRRDLYFCLDTTCMAIPYFLVGYYIAKSDILSRINLYRKCLCTLLCLIALLIVYKTNGPAQMNGPSFGNNILLNYLGGISGSMMVIFLVLKFKRISNSHKLIARNTLFLIFYHWVVLFVLGFVGFFNLWKLIDNPVWVTLIMAIYAILVLYSSIPVISLLNKKYPIVLGKRKVL